MVTKDWVDGLSHHENETVSECLELYDFTPEQEQEVRAAIQQRWRETSGRFHTYMVTHEIAAAHYRKIVSLGGGDESSETDVSSSSWGEPLSCAGFTDAAAFSVTWG
jgi:hypothetical protein